jgi:hypothetical protein
MATFLILPKRTAANASVVIWVMDEFEALSLPKIAGSSTDRHSGSV